MAGMPVATLRVWEQRYQAVRPATARSGHRLYSTTDVERVVLLRRLTELGHAIGSLAGLNVEQLREVLLAQASADTRINVELPHRSAPKRIVVVGHAMARRLERMSIRKFWASPPQVVGVFDSLNEATRAATGLSGEAIDLLLWQAADLQVGTLTELKAAQGAWRAGAVAIACRFSSATARNALTNAAVAVIREPSDDDALGTWLSSLGPAAVANADSRSKARSSKFSSSADTDAWSRGAMGLLDKAAPARRFDDIVLTEFAGLSSGIACDCPGHVAELLMQISSFEIYSASCSSRSPFDADLHGYLQRVAGAARVLFESALERVAVAEGYSLA
jgi:MerR family transcriptional regulator, light-induced transcriptional regulator